MTFFKQRHDLIMIFEKEVDPQLSRVRSASFAYLEAEYVCWSLYFRNKLKYKQERKDVK